MTARALRILLVTPGHEILGSPLVLAIVKSSVAPADMATVAALTPPEHEVRIWDEALDGRIQSASDVPPGYDVIGVGGYSADYARVVAVARALRDYPALLVAGGVGVTSEPEPYREHFDVLFLGEAELTWPAFVRDFENGQHRAVYRQVERVDMSCSPPPRWTRSLDLYGWGVVQTTRGCPFDCEFCDVISLFGRRPRHKSPDQVLAEVATLERAGVTAIMLSDDNFYGDRNYSKALLRRLIEQNRSFARPVRYWTQITLNVAKDEEMLGLLSEANVTRLLIGVETPNKESLVETNKPQNYEVDIGEALRTIQSYGFTIEANFIVGFDHDDRTIFDQQFDFIQAAYLHHASVWTLMAIPGTKLWARLTREGRVLKRRRTPRVEGLGLSFLGNVLPRKMTRKELLEGYRALLVRMNEWSALEERLGGFLLNARQFPPLMARYEDLSSSARVRLTAGLLFNRHVRRDLKRLVGDEHVRAIKERLHRLVPTESGLHVYLRQYAEKAVDHHFQYVTYRLPGLLRAIDHALEEELASDHELETTVFSVPDAFRQPYKAIFPFVHERVRAGLRDPSRVEPVLVEVFSDFLERWGATFERLEDHHQVNLLELCDRILARENRTEEAPRAPVPSPWLRFEPGTVPLLPRGDLRRASVDVLRCVENGGLAARHRPEARSFPEPSRPE